MKIFRALFVLILFAVVLAPAHAQDDQDKQSKKDAQVRTVHGVVLDKDENIVTGGIVYLQNKKTQVIRTYISDDEGQYRFSGLDPNVDYEIHAELNGLTSITHTVSSFDTRKDLVMSLKLDRKKTDK
jgi:protocatechuate 3,4-dioxygenase beta subunit